ncbi:MAG: Fur family transcriptional regulator [Sandaracinaceae bacterium]
MARRAPDAPSARTFRDQVAEQLRANGINPSMQRLAIAEVVLTTEAHPSADQVWSEVRARFPMVSRATVYNTLNLFVEKGLLRQFVLTEGSVVFDPRTEPHHHFIDDATGAIHDIAWDALEVRDIHVLPGIDVREYQVVLRGTRSDSPDGPSASSRTVTTSATTSRAGPSGKLPRGR